MTDIYDQISEEDLTVDLQMLSDACGLDTVRKILRHFNGISFYIPKITRFESFIIRYLKENSAKTFKQIAQELGVSEHFLRSIRKKMISDSKKV